MCKHAVAQLRLLFESGFYSRVAFIQDFMVRIINRPNMRKVLACTRAGIASQLTSMGVVTYKHGSCKS